MRRKHIHWFLWSMAAIDAMAFGVGHEVEFLGVGFLVAGLLFYLVFVKRPSAPDWPESPPPSEDEDEF